MSKQTPDQSETPLEVRPLTVAPPVLLLAGILVLLYPVLATQYNNQRRSQIAEQFNAVAEEVGPGAVAESLSRADEYDRAATRAPILSPWLDAQHPDTVQYQEYLSQLNLNDVMTTVKIPSTDVSLPIYRGTDAATLDKGIGHLLDTALPVGGESTRTVLTDHTSLGTTTIFNEPTSVQMGEFFYIETAGHHLKCQVTDIRVTLPNETGSLNKVEDKDLTTLTTCTPYRVDTRHLLMTGERVPMDDGDAQAEAEQVHSRVLQPWMITVLTSVAVILCVADWIWLRSRKRARKALEAPHPPGSLTAVEGVTAPNEDEASIGKQAH